MMDSKTQSTAVQNDALLAGRQQDAARIQHLLKAENDLRASLARQDATIAKQAATLAQQTSAPSNMTQVCSSL